MVPVSSHGKKPKQEPEKELKGHHSHSFSLSWTSSGGDLLLLLIRIYLFSEYQLIITPSFPFFICRIGLSGFDNPMRDQKTEEARRHIGQVIITRGETMGMTMIPYDGYQRKDEFLKELS